MSVEEGLILQMAVWVLGVLAAIEGVESCGLVAMGKESLVFCSRDLMRYQDRLGVWSCHGALRPSRGESL